MQVLNIINVLLSTCGTTDAINSYILPKGVDSVPIVTAAENDFAAKAVALGAKIEDMQSHVEDGYYKGGKGTVEIVWSTPIAVAVPETTDTLENLKGELIDKINGVVQANGEFITEDTGMYLGEKQAHLGGYPEVLRIVWRDGGVVVVTDDGDKSLDDYQVGELNYMWNQIK